MGSAPPGQVIDLIGPKGYTHGLVYHGPGRGTRTHTGRLAARDVRTQQGRLKNASPGLVADRATASLRGKRGSDYQHLAAARLHMAAARSASSPDLRARHLKMAVMHRGIASRTPGRGTRSEGPLHRPPSGSVAPKASSRLPTGTAALTAEGRRAAFKAGHAISPPRPGAPPGYPVTDARSWEKARGAVGRAGTPARRAELKALLRRTAGEFGKTKALRASWAAANTRPGVELAQAAYSRHEGEDVQCPSCHKYNMDDAKFCDQCGARLPESAFGHSNPPGRSVDLAAAAARPRLPVTSVTDLIISRDGDGTAVIRHRRGGFEIGRITHRGGDGAWLAVRGGKNLQPHTHQRAALAELIGTHNRDAGTPYHRPAAATSQQPPAQTPLMAAYGIQGTAANLATPTVGAGDGPRATGLDAGGMAIYKKLKARGFPDARAQAFARRARRRMKAAA